MGQPPIRKLEPLTREKLIRLLDPGRVFYRVAVRETIAEADVQELLALAAGVKEVQAEYKDFNGLIRALESAARKAAG